MKILQLASGDLWAGAEVQLFYLSRVLYNLDDITLLVVLLNHGQLEDILIKNGVNVIVLDESRLSTLGIIKRLYKIANEFQPDIIHTHRFKENFIGGFVSKITGKKSLRTVHGASESNSGAFSIRNLVSNGLDRLSSFMFQQKIVAVSDELGEKLSRIFPASKIVVIENSIDLEYLGDRANQTAALNVNSKSFNIAFVGRFVPVKRVDLFYMIARTVITSIKDKTINFYMVGDGPLKNELEQKITNEKLQDKVTLTGFIENTAPVLKQMDLLVFTSDHEGLPMVLLEAMVLGVPVLSRNLPTVKNVLCGGGCGYILNSDKIDDYVDMISTLVRDDSQLASIIERARKQVTVNYDIKVNAEKYINLYKAIL